MMYGVIRRYELTDAEWESLSAYLPSVVTGGRPVRTTAVSSTASCGRSVQAL